jgi:hypothetical protein
MSQDVHGIMKYYGLMQFPGDLSSETVEIHGQRDEMDLSDLIDADCAFAGLEF